MKKILLILMIITTGVLMAKAQTQDSCYVYANLNWRPTVNGNATIQLGNWKFEDVKNEYGQVLQFNSFIHALNYMSVKGWSLVETYPVNAELVTRNNAMTALIRKKMPIEEAKKYTGY